MKILYNWLKDYLLLDMSATQTASVLTEIGLEVESLEISETIPGGLRGVVTAQVVSCGKLAGSDHLSLTTVDTGEGDPVQVVCGAPNVAAGQKVLLATVGTQLTFTNGSQVTIKKSKIRGAESHGMICAEDELGIGTSHQGIMVLPPETPLGIPAAEYLNFPTYEIFEIGLTPNRIDAASHLGVARDLAAWYASHGKEVAVKRPDVSLFREDPSRSGVDVEVQAPWAAPRYCGITLENIKTEPSPLWMQDRLRMAGIRPVSNVVDITNYVMLETGQPLHAFDRDQIQGNCVVVRMADAGSRFVTLDGQERILDGQDLMICNKNEPMCIGGVFGGLGSGITEKTTSLFLESAWFHPAFIRRTSKRHGLKTDASFRFERGADPNATIYALKRAVLLMQEICGARVAGRIIDHYPNPVLPARVKLDYARMFSLMGKNIGKDTTDTILRALEINVIAKNEKTITVEVPTYRVDVCRECDVVEELLRIYGYNNIELPGRISSSIGQMAKPEAHRVRDSVAEHLSALGLREIMCNSLTSAGYYQNLETYPMRSLVRILNPLSNDLNAMRQTLLWGGLETIAYNINRQQYDLRFFEQGNVYSLNGNGDTLQGYREQQNLALFITGNDRAQNWHTPTRGSDFFMLKSYVDHIAALYRLDLQRLEYLQAPTDIFEEGILYLVKQKVLACMGRVNRTCLNRLGIRQDVFFAEINWDLFYNMIRNNRNQFTDLPRFPEVHRDLALVVDQCISYRQLQGIAFKTEKRLLKSVGLFDVYTGKGIPEGKKQYALSLVFQDPQKTLTDACVEQITEHLLEAFRKEAGAVLR
ncbi:MAG TPA: phenylalanine--tRNA ligase subunit beta [Bacteroidales bacterium]|nr:MAG: Phenylalanine--tRNA ligase beta subunit [Bacteroidetes bacterium ADurb.Bin139]HOG24805.1 phenylalanine--tRNA ligase subunit beta [Bacteroidales bacterium]HOR11985.1 phenylalanine--tRNA ligase subunit beta [Bacteroidales bacterium]HOZ19642.1 phenylalanine--tRNA ligase subunit beta [Bacteroidales bacterium]HPB77123.1 phenylalanine--tRNA ligase subunit beta [Bacteroidales bacterium]